MGKQTAISWCDHTHNEWWGCVKEPRRPACAHCYADRVSLAFGWKGLWGPNSRRRLFDARHSAEPLAWNRQAEAEGKMHLVFAQSMGDIFEDRRDLDTPRERFWNLVEQTPWLIWLFLTKRIQNADRLLPARWRENMPENVWTGITIETQDVFDSQWPKFQVFTEYWRPHRTFISCGPLLGRIDIAPALEETLLDVESPIDPESEHWSRPIDWLLAEGESGDGARITDPEDLRYLWRQAQAYQVPFHFKGWGEWAPCDYKVDPRIPTYIATQGERIARLGHRKTGRLLDGVEILDFPEY
jgi:protein gp37